MSPVVATILAETETIPGYDDVDPGADPSFGNGFYVLADLARQLLVRQGQYPRRGKETMAKLKRDKQELEAVAQQYYPEAAQPYQWYNASGMIDRNWYRLECALASLAEVGDQTWSEYSYIKHPRLSNAVGNVLASYQHLIAALQRQISREKH